MSFFNTHLVNIVLCWQIAFGKRCYKKIINNTPVMFYSLNTTIITIEINLWQYHSPTNVLYSTKAT